MNETIFKYGKEIIAKLKEFNFAAYFVGGCVRDLLLNRPIDDVDIVTEASPEQLMEIFPKTIPLGIEHGTVIVRHRNYSFEITTFRSANETLDGPIKISDDILKEKLRNDLKLRDFTINAIAMTNDGTIIDPFNGRKAINERVIKGVHDDYQRLIEDPLRILRAYRFVSELGFTIDSQTFHQMKIVNQHLTNIAIERMNQEFTKLLKGKHVKKAFQYIIDGKTLNYLPTLKNHQSVFVQLQNNIQPLGSLSEFLALVNYLDENLTIQSFAKTWKCSRKIVQEARILYNALCEYKRNGFSRWLVYQLGKKRLTTFLKLNHILYNEQTITYNDLIAIYDSLPIYSEKDIVISGLELKKLFSDKKPGQWIKETLHTIEKEIVNGRLKNDFTQIKEWVLCHPPDVD